MPSLSVIALTASASSKVIHLLVLKDIKKIIESPGRDNIVLPVMHQSFVSTAPPPPPTYRGWAGIMIYSFQNPGINSALWGQAEGPRGFGDLGRMAIYFQGAGEHL